MKLTSGKKNMWQLLIDSAHGLKLNSSGRPVLLAFSVGGRGEEGRGGRGGQVYGPLLHDLKLAS